MNALPIAILVLSFTTDLAVREGLVSSYAALAPDLLSGLALVIVAARYLVTRTLYLDSRYLVLLGLLLLSMSIAILWQAPASGTIVSGLRYYFKFVPLLLLPAVYPFTPKQIKAQLAVLAALVAAQPPLAIYQRFVQYAGDMHLGDLIKGSLTSSGTLSLIAICAIGFVVCAYLRGRLGMLGMVLATVYLSTPTMINETKIAIALIPLAIVFPVLCMPDRARLWRKLLPIVAAGGVTLAIFVPVYDFIAQYNRYNTPIADFLSETSLSDYLYTGRSSAVETGYVGRADSMMFPIDRLARDPTSLAFGLGIGNVSPSPIASFSGEYVRYDALFGAGMTQISLWLWEIGIVGAVLYLLLFFVFLQDALWLSRQNGFYGLFGQAWATTIVLLIPGLFYLALFGLDEIHAPLWLYAGIVAAERARRRAASQTVPHAAPLKPTVSLPGLSQ